LGIVNAKDKAGNVTQPTTITYTVALTPPLCLPILGCVL
jgi:hypothetical protein